MHLLRPNPRALVPATLLLTALAGSVPPAAAWQSSTPQFVISNRYAVQGIDNDGWELHATSQVLNGAILLDEPDDAASYRFVFREAAQRDAQAVWVHCKSKGIPLLGYRVRVVLDDGNGRPSTTGTAPVQLVAPTGQPAWVRVPLASPLTLAPGGLYHVLFDYADPQSLEQDPDSDRHLVLWCARARHPVPYLPYDQTSSEPKATYEDELAALVLKDGTQHCFLTKIDAVKGYPPVFLIEHTAVASASDPRLFGNPYNAHEDLLVGHDATSGLDHVAGERITPTATSNVNYVAFLTGATGLAGSTKPAGPLYVEIYEQQGTGPIQVKASTTLLPAGGGNLVRWHWNAAYFSPAVELTMGNTYYLVLNSPGSARPSTFDMPGGYVVPAEYSNQVLSLPGFPDVAGEVPTYGLDSSVAIQADVDSSGALVNVTSFQADLADVGFVLGMLEPRRAVAMNDEIDVTNLGCPDEFRSAHCLHTLSTAVVVRNLGLDADPGTIYCNLRVLPTGGFARSFLQGPRTTSGTCKLPANSDNEDIYDFFNPCRRTPAVQLPFEMCTETPSTLRVKFQIELGWVSPNNTQILDDLVPLEVWLNDGDCGCF